LASVDRSGGPDACHPWTGPLDDDGYGRLGNKKAHRVACELAHGPAPSPKHEAMHSCDFPPCCNGRHLSWGTHAQNVADQIARGRHRNCRPYGKPYRCGTCGELGHNARTCSRHIPRPAPAANDGRAA
jgi:hypothetical protein